EPGKTGSLWRLLYSLRLPDLLRDFFDLTPGQGTGSVEVLSRYSVRSRAAKTTAPDEGPLKLALMGPDPARAAEESDSESVLRSALCLIGTLIGTLIGP